MNTELEVKVTSEGGTITISPLGLLEHFLPGAKLMPGSNRVYEGHKPGRPNEKLYVQTEALISMLMEMRDKKIGLSGIYLIASNAPDKPAGHKIKYDVGVQRARRIPGFLGMNMGLIVLRNRERVETAGEERWEGDVLKGAWSELYVQGLPHPLRHCISKWTSPAPGSRVTEEFMACKTAIDHLLRLHYPTLYAGEEEEEHALESAATSSFSMLASVSPPEAEAASSSQPSNPVFIPGQIYVGTLIKLQPRLKRAGRTDSAGVIELETEQGPLLCFFFTRPEVLRKEELDWQSLIGQPAAMSFVERKDKAGKAWWYVDEFLLAGVDGLAGENTLPPDSAEEGV